MSDRISKEGIFDVLVQRTRNIVPELQGHPFQWSDSLRELGANSIDRADIMMEVMEALRLNIPRVELLGPRNIGEIVELIHAKLT